MSERIHHQQRREPPADRLPHPEHKSADELRAEMDGLLDDIDRVLEESGLATEAEAQAQVANFRQAGGE